MDGLRNPVGDEPPQTYWRRRLVVLISGVVLILLVWFLVSATLADDGESGEEDPATTPATTNSPQVASTDAAAPDRPCTAEDVGVSAVASPSAVNVGSMPAFDVAVEHTGASACALSSNADGTQLIVRSGEDVYYNSAWCTDIPVFTDTDWILQPGDREALQATWTGQRYNEDCEAGSTGAAGTYRAEIAVAGVAAEEAVFTLVE